MFKKAPILSFFWPFIKPYKWYYLLMLLGPVVYGFYPFAYNYAIKLFLDTMAHQPTIDYNDLITPIAIFLIAQISLDVSWRIGDFAQWKSEPLVGRAILLSCYDYVQHHSYAFFQNNFSGNISSKIRGILDGYTKVWNEIHYGFSIKILKIIVNFVALFVINLNVGGFIFAWACVYIPLIARLSGHLNELSFHETESRHSLIGQISDKITNILSLLSFSTRRKELDNLNNDITNDFIPKQIKVYYHNFKIQLLAGILYFVKFTFLLFYMVHLKKANLISIGDFAFVFGIALVIAEDVWHATIEMQTFSRALGDLRSSLSIITLPHAAIDKKSATELTVKQPTIVFENMGFSYTENDSLFEKFNLHIKAGEKIGIVGTSGAGKSSLINLLLRYFDQSEGRILVDNQNIQDVTQDSLRKNIAVIPQDTLLFHRTIKENIRYGKLTASDQEVIIASKNAYIHDFIMTLPDQYNTEVGERGIKLSGGQRQRIAIARAFLKDAPILILDEATSALDSHTEQLIQDSLHLFMQDNQKTIIAIAHRLSTLKHMDRVIVLEKGQIVEEGTHAGLIEQQNSLYKKLWELQKI